MKPIKALPSPKRDKVAFPATAAPAVPGPSKLKEHYRSLLLGLIKAPFFNSLWVGKIYDDLNHKSHPDLDPPVSVPPG